MVAICEWSLGQVSLYSLTQSGKRNSFCSVGRATFTEVSDTNSVAEKRTQAELLLKSQTIHQSSSGKPRPYLTGA